MQESTFLKEKKKFRKNWNMVTKMVEEEYEENEESKQMMNSLERVMMEGS